ncbi:MAG: flagellar basal body-associated protein FliL [Candidatus Scalinduaceae bacterium]
MSVIAIISIVCSFVFVTKLSTPFGEYDFETQDVGSAYTTEETIGVQGEDTKIESKKKKKSAKETESKSAEKSGVKNNNEEIKNAQDKFIIMPMEKIVVNLGGVDGRRYLRVQINMEIKNEESQNIVNKNMVILRDKMISFLTIKTTNEIEMGGDLFKLRLEIKNILNKLLGSNDIIKQIYFSDFIVQ